MKTIKYIAIYVIFLICISNINAYEAISNPYFTTSLYTWWTALENADWGPVPIGSVVRSETLGSSCAKMYVYGAPCCVILLTPTKENLNVGDSVWTEFYSTDMSTFGGVELFVGNYFVPTGSGGQIIQLYATAGYHRMKITCNRSYSKGTVVGFKLVVWPGEATVWLMKARAGNGVMDIEENVLPKNTINNKFYIQGPNPTNKNVHLVFSIDRQSPTTLRVYNGNGQLVKDFDKGILSPGKYEIIWDGTDNTGRIVSNNIYFYELKTEGMSYNRKSIILR